MVGATSDKFRSNDACKEIYALQQTSQPHEMQKNVKKEG
jgi:hypothetical protein